MFTLNTSTRNDAMAHLLNYAIATIVQYALGLMLLIHITLLILSVEPYVVFMVIIAIVFIKLLVTSSKLERIFRNSDNKILPATLLLIVLMIICIIGLMLEYYLVSDTNLHNYLIYFAYLTPLISLIVTVIIKYYNLNISELIDDSVRNYVVRIHGIVIGITITYLLVYVSILYHVIPTGEVYVKLHHFEPHPIAMDFLFDSFTIYIFTTIMLIAQYMGLKK